MRLINRFLIKKSAINGEQSIKLLYWYNNQVHLTIRKLSPILSAIDGSQIRCFITRKYNTNPLNTLSYYPTFLPTKY